MRGVGFFTVFLVAFFGPVDLRVTDAFFMFNNASKIVRS
jgi:hypothetical protein